MQEVIGSTPIFSTQRAASISGRPFSLMPFATYILYSASTDRYYVGHAEDPPTGARLFAECLSFIGLRPSLLFIFA